MQKIFSLFLVFSILIGLTSAIGESAGAPMEYAAVNRITDSRTMSGTIESTGADENAILVVSGNTAIKDAQISRVNTESSGGDGALNYGIGTAVLVTDGTVDIINSSVTTQADGGTGLFSYGSGVATASNCAIDTTNDMSCGIRVAAGGTLFASELSVMTHGTTSAAIGSGAGGGSMLINGGSYITYGTDSPAVHAAGDFTANSASMVANHSEALRLEGLNTVRLMDCVLSGSMDNLELNDRTWTVAVYQPTSAEQANGTAVFEMSGGTLDSGAGNVFLITNTQSVITLENVIILKNDNAVLIRCTGNDGSEYDWGEPGANGADCVFTAVHQTLSGNIIYDRISGLQMYLCDGSTYTGEITLEESETAEEDNGNGRCDVFIDGSSCWIVCGNCALNSLSCEGIILDNEGKTVSVIGTDGESYVEGNSSYTITVSEYNTAADMSGAHSIDRS